jgi:uncharacterized lipoprotein YajG
MKKLIFVLSLAILAACSSPSEEVKTNEKNPVKTAKNYVAVYDFHSANRCETCRAIEKETKETLNEHFKNELKDSSITFRLINAEAEKNAALAEEYAAFGTTLAITVFKDGEKEIIDETNWAFDAIHGDDFKEELTEKLNSALEKL